MKNTLKINRAVKGVSQQKLAELVNVSRQAINAVENNRMIPSTALALKLSVIFEKSVNELFFLEEKDL